MKEQNAYLEQIFSAQPYKIVISNGSREQKYKKHVLQLKTIGGTLLYQRESYTNTQVFHENMSMQKAREEAKELMEHYRQLDAFANTGSLHLKRTKKGTVLFQKKQGKGASDADIGGVQGNNRKKRYLIEEGSDVPPLVDMGIFTKEGNVVRSMYDKFRQINRFLELIDDTVRESPKKEWNIVDFGCGKSYLTFVVYHYFSEIKKLPVTIRGLDLKEEVIKECSRAAFQYGYQNLHFEVGDISRFSSSEKADMVITLHACDTATDYALYHAICSETDYIFSVPCCQHELNGQIKTDTLSALTKYGLIKERFSALMTDAIRGCLLEAQGYKTQLLEFVDFTHTPKNMLIRAVRSGLPKQKRELSLQEAQALMQEFQAEPTLYRLLYQTKTKEENHAGTIDSGHKDDDGKTSSE